MQNDGTQKIWDKIESELLAKHFPEIAAVLANGCWVETIEKRT